MKPRLILTASLMMSLVMCCRMITLLRPTPTPLPAWRSPVGELLLEEDGVFPDGWVWMRDRPQDLTDPTINHVSRFWWGQAQGAGKAYQVVWRAYTIEDAKEKYAELRQSPLFLSSYTPSPWEFYVDFRPPSEIGFKSKVADEFYLACGWRDWAYCKAIARYRNYVVYMWLDLEAEHEGRVTYGLTYQEIETVLEAMDAKFAAFLAAHPLSTPVP